MKCIICGKEFKKSTHLLNQHNISGKEYYDKYLKGPNESKCIICGKPTNFIKITQGYYKTCCRKCAAISGSDKMKQTKLERYGDPNFVNIEKCKNTKLQRYGNENYNNTEQNIKTCLNRYGVENIFQQKDIKKTILEKRKEVGIINIVKKTKNTKLEQYGDENYNNREKAISTCIKKYGVSNAFQMSKTRKLLKELEEHKRTKKFPVIVKSFEKRGYTVLTTLDEFQEDSTVIRFICPEKHEHHILLSNWYKRHKCGICGLKYSVSRPELEIQEFLNSINIEFISNDRIEIINPNTGHNLELDIWIPSLRKAIEFNGGYWHNKPEVIKNDKIKKEQCKKLDIELLIIEETIWLNFKDQCLNMIENFLHKKEEEEI